MPPKFLLDENVEGAIWDAIQQHNKFSPLRIIAIRIGDPSDLPLGLSDPDIIRWAQKNVFIVVSRDVSTLKDHMASHLIANQHCPGLFLFTRRLKIQTIVELLAVASQSDNPLEWQDLIEYLG